MKKNFNIIDTALANWRSSYHIFNNACFVQCNLQDHVGGNGNQGKMAQNKIISNDSDNISRHHVWSKLRHPIFRKWVEILDEPNKNTDTSVIFQCPRTDSSVSRNLRKWGWYILICRDTYGCNAQLRFVVTLCGLGVNMYVVKLVTIRPSKVPRISVYNAGNYTTHNGKCTLSWCTCFFMVISLDSVDSCDSFAQFFICCFVCCWYKIPTADIILIAHQDEIWEIHR